MDISGVIILVAVFIGVLWFILHERRDNPLIGKQILEINLIIDDDTKIADLVKRLEVKYDCFEAFLKSKPVAGKERTGKDGEETNMDCWKAKI